MLGKEFLRSKCDHEVTNKRLVGFIESAASARIFLCAVIVMAFIATPADAHQGTGLAGGFRSGFFHPLTGLDHMLAMVSVGIWGAYLGRPLVFALPMIFPTAMAFGGAVGMAGIPLPPVELGIALSVITLGLMILLSVRARVSIACLIVGIFALFHGYAHGAELPSAADPIGYSAGFVLSTGLLHIAGIAIGFLRSLKGGDFALRAAGGGVAASGLWFLWGALGL